MSTVCIYVKYFDNTPCVQVTYSCDLKTSTL